MMGISFTGFFSNEIKEAIKTLPGAHYDGRSKLWKLKTELREALINAVGPACIEEGVQMTDIPKFILEFQAHPTPLSNSGVAYFKQNFKSLRTEFNYEAEINEKDRTIEKLPEKMQASLYGF
jgi:SNF2 family DNA or RNA helicase